MLSPFSDFVVQEFPRQKVILDLFEDKYKPDDLTGFVGNKKQQKILKQWVSDIRHQKSKQLFTILYGPYGIGKSLLSRLILKDFNIIEYENITEKNKFFQQFKKIITSESIEEIFFNSKPTAVIIENIDKSIGDGVYFKKFTDLLENNKNVLKTPIICINSSENIKKKYNTPSKIFIVKLEYPETNEMFEYCKKIEKAEQINLTKTATENIIGVSKYDFRKILHYYKLLTLGKAKETFTTKDIVKIINFSDTDLFYSAYEIIDEAFNDNIQRDITQLVENCYPDQPLINDLLYSNATNGLQLESTSKILDGFSFSDIFQNYVFRNQEWRLRDYSIINGAINGLHTIREDKKRRKQTKLKKNQLNNLPWNCLKNKNTLIDIQKSSLQNHKDNMDILYTFENIIQPTINKKIEENTLDDEDLKYLIQNGYDATKYARMFSIINKKPIQRKHKNFLDKKFKIFNT